MAYHPALIAERLVPFALRRRTHIALGWLTALAGLAVLFFAPWLGVRLGVARLGATGLLDMRLMGAFFFFLAIWLISCCFRALHFYYADVRWPLAETLFRSRARDPLKGFMRSAQGRALLTRLGATSADITVFLQNRDAIIPARELVVPLSISFVDYVLELSQADKQFARFLLSLGVTGPEAALAAAVVAEELHLHFERERWWSRGSLARISPLLGSRQQTAPGTLPIIGANSERRTLVEDFLRRTTGLPHGGLSEHEHARLAYAETVGNQRLLGRDEALHAVIGAARRAYAHGDSAGKPLGSFVLVGPTPTAQKETLGALGDIFFGPGALAAAVDAPGEAAWGRLDMVEYAGEPDTLAAVVRHQPYGVLVLDNFEKIMPAAVTLLSQILEEGFFSTEAGEKIDCRSTLLVAVFQPGAEVLWDALQRSTSPSHARELVLEKITQAGLLSPLLVDHFDGSIVFHPVATEHAERLARIQLEKLAASLAKRGYTLAITDELVEFILQAGPDPKLGARPMTRAIVDIVERAAAEKIIAGDLPRGATIVLGARDFSFYKNYV